MDDEFAIREFLSDGLSDAGYHVLTAPNASEALHRVRQEPPDVVLLDLLMPEMDGLAFLRERLTQPPLAAVPVLVLSAAGREARREAAALRATAVLAKPLNLDVLSAVLEHVLRDAALHSADALAPMAAPLGNCPICRLPVYAAVDSAQPDAVRMARQRHVLSHTAREIASVPLRARLFDLPVGGRRILADWVYRELRDGWGDQDRRGVHTIDEALDAPAVHRLFHAASTCYDPSCRHE